MFFGNRAPTISRGLIYDQLYDSKYISASEALRNSDVWTAINIISSDIARAIPTSPKTKISKLLNRPSENVNRFSFYQHTVAQLLLTGNAYWLWREKVDGSYGFEYIPNSNITEYISDDGQEITYDVKFDAQKEKDLENVASSDVMHFRLLGNDGGLTGMSPIQALSNELSIQDSSNTLAKTALNKSARPSGIVKVEKGTLNPDAKDKIRTEFESKTTGSNSGRVLVMDSVTTYTPLEVKNDSTSLLDATSWTREQIAKAFMIPIDMLGGESAHSNIEQIRSVYNTTIGRYLAPIQSELSMKLNADVDFDIKPSTDLDGSNLETRVADLVSKGVITSAVAQQVLLQSQSDVITQQIIDAVVNSGNELIPAEKKGIVINGQGS
jgi:HK97 family phage portal protein